MAIRIEQEGITDALNFFKAVPEVASKSAAIAINQVLSRTGMAMIRGGIEDQVKFPKGYLTGDRLRVSKAATVTDLEGVITARQRATSLARFANGAAIGRPGVSVRVSDNRTKFMQNAWLVRLKRGASLTQDNYNIGLAVRLKPGTKLFNKNAPHKDWLVKDRVALLYGPSVDQVFRNVADDMALPIAALVETEFFRQLDFRI